MKFKQCAAPLAILVVVSIFCFGMFSDYVVEKEIIETLSRSAEKKLNVDDLSSVVIDILRQDSNINDNKLLKSILRVPVRPVKIDKLKSNVGFTARFVFAVKIARYNVALRS
jgi:hypothetical protein